MSNVALKFTYWWMETVCSVMCKCKTFSIEHKFSISGKTWELLKHFLFIHFPFWHIVTGTRYSVEERLPKSRAEHAAQPKPAGDNRRGVGVSSTITSSQQNQQVISGGSFVCRMLLFEGNDFPSCVVFQSHVSYFVYLITYKPHYIKPSSKQWQEERQKQ